jgi:hypothetical protein
MQAHALQVHVFWDRTSPPEYSVFSPAAQSAEPTLIGGNGFRALKQFVLFQKFRHADPEYAAMFTSEREPELRRAFASTHEKVTGAPAPEDATLNTMLDFMQKDEAYLAFKAKVFSPVAASFFSGLTDSLRERGPELMRLWVDHRFGHLLDRDSLPGPVTFVSDTYVSYAQALTDLFGPKPQRPELDARLLTRMLGKQPCLLDLAFGRERNLDQARTRRLLPESADCPFRKLRSLLT